MYGISLDAYKAMLEAQGGACAVCKQPERLRDSKGKVKRLALDHNKKTGVIRSLLCNGCNRALGYANEDPEVLRTLARYLEAYS
jgi:hypothetical protein